MQTLASALPVVLDADALTLLAGNQQLSACLRQRSAPTILTPHPAEAARLLACTTADVQANRLAAACEMVSRYASDVALKGCGTVLATVDGQWWINPSGNPGLASAGTGDVLTGFIVALLAQSWPAEAALLAAVHLHGAAADWLVQRGVGPLGLTASELLPVARQRLNQWIADKNVN